MILKGDGKEFDIPLFVHEITLPRYISFMRARQKYHSGLSGKREEVQEALLGILPSLVEGDLSALPFHERQDGDFSTIGLDYRGVLSLWHIYAHLLNLIDSYKPDLSSDYSFEWMGKRYFIEPERAKRMLLQKAYTAGEVIELHEFSRKVDTKMRHNAKKDGFDVDSADKVLDKPLPKDKKEKTGLQEKKSKVLRELEVAGDPNGNLAFMLSKRQMAVLARRHGEKLPINKGERESFLKQRERLFAEIPLDIYLNVRFFLLAILSDYNPQGITGHSSDPSKNRFTVIPRKGNGMTGAGK